MKANKFAEILHVDPRTRPPLLVTSPQKIVTWFDQKALVTRVVCFSRSIERKSSLFANICLFIDDENSVTISETQEYLVLVISGYLLAIFRVNLAFSVSVFAICDHVYGECCQQFSIHVLIHLAVFFWIGMKGDGLLYIKVILHVTTRYFFCLHLKKLLTYFLSSTVCIVKMVRSIG